MHRLYLRTQHLSLLPNIAYRVCLIALTLLVGAMLLGATPLPLQALPQAGTNATSYATSSPIFVPSNTYKCPVYLQINVRLSPPVPRIPQPVAGVRNTPTPTPENSSPDRSILIGRYAGGCLSPQLASQYLSSTLLEHDNTSIPPLQLTSIVDNSNREVSTCEGFLMSTQEGFRPRSRANLNTYYQYARICKTLGAATLAQQGSVPIFPQFTLEALHFIPVTIIPPLTVAERRTLMDDANNNETLFTYYIQGLINFTSPNNTQNIPTTTPTKDTLAFTYKGRETNISILAVSDFNNDGVKEYLLATESRSNYGTFHKLDLSLLWLPTYTQAVANFETASILCQYEGGNYRCRKKLVNSLKYLD